MPVDILNIPEKKKITKSHPSLWRWGCVGILIISAYIYVFLVYFSQYLSKEAYLFWPELLLVPLMLWIAFYMFRVLLWNNESIEVTNWNETRNNYYTELINRGRVCMDILDFQIRMPAINGSVSERLHDLTPPMRITPNYTHKARFLAFNYNGDILKTLNSINIRKEYLFEDIIDDLLDDIYIHCALIPPNSKIRIICILQNDLRDIMEKAWRIRFMDKFPERYIEFTEDFSYQLDSWLDSASSEYAIFIGCGLFDKELLNDGVDNQTELIFFMFGRYKASKSSNKPSLGSIYRPEYGWQGIDKSLLWGDIPDREKLSGVVYSGLSDQEKNDLIFNVADVMSEQALLSHAFIDTSNVLCVNQTLTEILQVNYAHNFLMPGYYLFVNKCNGILKSNLYALIASNNTGL